MSTLLSLDILEELRDQVGIELIETLQHELAEDAGQRITEMESLFTQQDPESLRKEAHTLKSSTGTLGLEKVSQQAAIIERTIVNETGENITDLIPTLRPLLTDSLEALNQWVSGQVA